MHSRTRRFLMELGYEPDSTKDENLCCIPDCRNNRCKTHSTCSKHHTELKRKRNPASYQYRRLKMRAKQRRKPFDITKAEWAELCLLTRYHENTGQSRTALTIDRIDSRKGYRLDNIRVIVKHLNCAKGNYERKTQLKTGRFATICLDPAFRETGEGDFPF